MTGSLICYDDLAAELAEARAIVRENVLALRADKTKMFTVRSLTGLSKFRIHRIIKENKHYA